MPSIRKLSPEEIQVVQRGGKELSKRQQTASEYDSYLADLDIGEYAEVELGEDESRLTVVNRFKSAAERKGVGLKFFRGKGKIIQFQVIEQRDAQQEDGDTNDEELPTEGDTIPAPPVEEAPVGTDAPPKKRGGRPKKQVA